MRSRMPTILGYVLVWFLLSALAVVLAFQWHSIIEGAGYLIINTPSLRPYGWSSTTLSGISSMAYLVLGAITLGVLTFIEQSTRHAARDGQLTRLLVRYLAIMLGIGLLGFLFNIAIRYLL